jgi:hypothetical protein
LTPVERVFYLPRLLVVQANNYNVLATMVYSVLDPGIFDPMPNVTVTFEDGQIKELFSFYLDELRVEFSLGS